MKSIIKHFFGFYRFEIHSKQNFASLQLHKG